MHTKSLFGESFRVMTANTSESSCW
jgi:hypothetical protein